MGRLEASGAQPAVGWGWLDEIVPMQQRSGGGRTIPPSGRREYGMGVDVRGRNNVTVSGRADAGRTAVPR
jgi:hypothetical protein